MKKNTEKLWILQVKKNMYSVVTMFLFYARMALLYCHYLMQVLSSVLSKTFIKSNEVGKKVRYKNQAIPL